MSAADEIAACGSMTQVGANQLILPGILGWALRVYFFGAVTSSALSYLTASHSRTSKVGRRLVMVVVALDAFGAFLNLYEVVFWGSLQVRTFEALAAFHYVDLMAPVPAIFIALIVQVFFAKRATRFIGNRRARQAFIVFMTILIGGSFLSGLALEVITIVYTYVPDAHLVIAPWSFNRSVSLSNWFTAITDVAISIALWMALRSKVSGFSAHTDQLLQRVALAGLTTASYTSLFAVAAALLSAIFYQDDSPWINIFLPFWLPLPSLYVLSLLATLNLQKEIVNPPRDPNRQGAMTSFSKLQISVMSPRPSHGEAGAFNIVPSSLAGRAGSPTTSRHGVATIVLDEQRATSPRADGGMLRSQSSSDGDELDVEGRLDEKKPDQVKLDS